MSIFRCEQCDTLCDADQEGCEEHPFKELVCVCERCYEFLIEIDPHCRCGKYEIGDNYCKITDQYRCSNCGRF